MPFAPNFRITPETVKALMGIEAARAAVDSLPIRPQLIASLRESARLLSTHYSTQIEGNRLTAAEVEKVIAGKGRFPGRERDEREVRNYYQAVEKAEAISALKRPFRENDIQILHGLVMHGRAKPTGYRDGQNVIRESGSGSIVYLPPEAHDVPPLMRELLDWTNGAIEEKTLPLPVIAALAHYQFATIHPYYDGNGRTARLLTTLILHRCGYGLKGIYSLEEYYARNLPGYYGGLATGESHNYYFGRETADLSGFVEYFCVGMADAFSKVRARAESIGVAGHPDKSAMMRELRSIQRQALGLFVRSKVVTSNELAEYLGLSPRQGRNLCAKWIEEDFLAVENPSRKARSYRLAHRFEPGLIL
jgi:Fic family protein